MKLAKIVAAAMVLCTAGALYAGGQKSEGGASGGQKGPGNLKIVLILPGPINDQSWNATNYAG
ncbi:MAG: BMP family ABC transporter substrate-binding protein, partial [Treponema sp.]|nr:BMP family ABC transporter substrate-binding protein [Treponema sp.]